MERSHRNVTTALAPVPPVDIGSRTPGKHAVFGSARTSMSKMRALTVLAAVTAVQRAAAQRTDDDNDDDGTALNGNWGNADAEASSGTSSTDDESWSGFVF